jgi:putative hemolysin
MQRAARVARQTAPLIALMSRVLRPAIWFLTRSAAGVLHLLGIRGDLAPDNATEEEIRMMLDESEEEGLIESTEGEMIDNIFEFNNIQIYDVMTHRVDVDSIDLHASREEITECIRTTGFSRFPVFEDTPDNIVGILYMKDFFLNQDTPLPQLIKEPIFVPDSMICDDLFRKMQREHTHFAVVTDEYGAFQGIVTLEDLIEEIVGNIYDEYDEKEDYIIPNPDGSWTISGRAELKDVEKALDLSLAEREEFNTLSGLILSETEEIPRDGEQFEVEVDGLHIQVLRVAERRIEETRVTKLPKADDGEET